MEKQSKLPFNLYLIGFMGCGKSSAARYMHRTYGMPVIEMDETIVTEAGMSINEMFRTRGEAYFRERETELLRKLSKVSNTVISCGGGAAMRQENVDLMKASGKVILLTAEPETILARVGHDNNRPLLEGRKNVEGIRELMEQRRPAYERAADLVISTDNRSESEICEEILRQVGV